MSWLKLSSITNHTCFSGASCKNNNNGNTIKTLHLSINSVFPSYQRVRGLAVASSRTGGTILSIYSVFPSYLRVRGLAVASSRIGGTIPEYL